MQTLLKYKGQIYLEETYIPAAQFCVIFFG